MKNFSIKLVRFHSWTILSWLKHCFDLYLEAFFVPEEETIWIQFFYYSWT